MSMPRERKMAVRPIDGEALLGIERLLDTDVVRKSETASWLLDQVLHDIQAMPTLPQPNEPERSGLYGKYTVYKNKDGSLVTDCFILHPEKDLAAVAALRAYAVATDNAELAADIINWVGAEPNEPLTLEQLREMDGEPVYLIVDDGYEPLEMWALIDVPEEDHIVLINNIGGRSAYYSDDGLKQDHITVYRRPPKGEEDKHG